MDHNLTQKHTFSLSLYLLLVFALSWPFQIAIYFLDGNFLTRYIFTSLSMVMVMFGTFICGRFIFRDGFTQAGWRMGKFKHYLIVVGLVFFLWGIPSLIGIGLGRNLPESLTDEQTILVFVFMSVTIIPSFGEEFGWRGYLLPRLAQRFNIVKAVIFHAVIWWAWHLPVVIGTALQDNPNITVIIGKVIIGAIPVVLHAVIFAYIWLYTRSIAVVTVYHAAYDGVRTLLQMILGFGVMTLLWVNVLIIIIGILLLIKVNWSNLEKSHIN